MGIKNRAQKARKVQALSHDISIEDDPYWKISSLFVNEERLGRYVNRFIQFEKRQYQWVNDIMNGFPTYYCIMGVSRGATILEVIQAFERRIEFSCYPDEVIIEAFRVLQNPGLRKEYDEFLFVFEQFSKILPPSEKKELIELHSKHIAEGKLVGKVEEIRKTYNDYFHLFLEGMPDIYEFAGLEKDLDIETLKGESPKDSELLKKIYSVLTDPASRENYDTMINFVYKHLEREALNNLEKKKEYWKHIDKEISDKIMLLALTEPDAINKFYSRCSKILNINQDWKQYLPPADETFFSILGVDEGSIKADKKDLEKILRDKYRKFERTPKVNLAYSVLKNMSMREDYLWLNENLRMLDVINSLFSETKTDRPMAKRSFN